ncbi:hypothetical protein A3G62_00085 [Candidatus Kaiserbacteria bacterium RIFCSPLOWO2_12_FULL_50_10]|nr:MAG: hypothetical protein A3G62_00085 [Candidatus Kaiserbacteria bacterium RIFCSPLOWO2_12_FULL_50_10]
METYDLIILGGGPAGISAGVYASRKQLKTLLVTKEWGGQSVVSETIYNWIGTPAIAGAELAKALENHLKSMPENTVSVKVGGVAAIEKGAGTHTVVLENGEKITAKAILIATGSGRRKLDVPGADTFEHKGVTYCASCDGPLFAGMDVVVVGGGNAGFESAAQLLAYAKSVTLLHRSAEFKADPVTVEKVLANPKMKAILNAVPTKVEGDKFAKSISYKDKISGEEITLPAEGIFVEIGVVPNTGYAISVVDTDPIGHVTIDPWTQKTSVPGIWAAGDCTNVRYHQNNISAGDGVKALEDIYVTLKTT